VLLALEEKVVREGAGTLIFISIIRDYKVILSERKKELVNRKCLFYTLLFD
jgi:hypothetical protein